MPTRLLFGLRTLLFYLYQLFNGFSGNSYKMSYNISYLFVPDCPFITSVFLNRIAFFKMVIAKFVWPFMQQRYFPCYTRK
jgi:hypothetical protein